MIKKPINIVFYFYETEIEFCDNKNQSEFMSCINEIREINVNGEKLSSEKVEEIISQSKKKFMNNFLNKICELGEFVSSDFQSIKEHILKSYISFELPFETFDYKKLCLIPSFIYYNDGVDYHNLLDDDYGWSIYRVLYDGQEIQSYSLDYGSRGISTKEICRV